jgi:hypothetical protein
LLGAVVKRPDCTSGGLKRAACATAACAGWLGKAGCGAADASIRGGLKSAQPDVCQAGLSVPEEHGLLAAVLGLGVSRKRFLGEESSRCSVSSAGTLEKEDFPRQISLFGAGPKRPPWPFRHGEATGPPDASLAHEGTSGDAQSFSILIFFEGDSQSSSRSPHMGNGLQIPPKPAGRATTRVLVAASPICFRFFGGGNHRRRNFKAAARLLERLCWAAATLHLVQMVVSCT